MMDEAGNYHIGGIPVPLMDPIHPRNAGGHFGHSTTHASASQTRHKAGSKLHVNDADDIGVLERYTQYARFESGMVATYYYGFAGRVKLVWYDLKSLVQIGGVATMWVRGTYFTMDRGALVLMSAVVSVFWMMTMGLILCNDRASLAKYDSTDLEQFAILLNIFVPLVLGLYVSLEMKRWWAMRVDALGRVFDATINVCMLAACALPDDCHRNTRDLVAKWSMASIVLLVKAARYNDDFDDLHQKGYLSRLEFHRLQEYDEYGRAMIMWCWVLRLMQETMYHAHGPLPLCLHLGMVEEMCCNARDGIQEVHTYLQTQLPFAYVHLITIIVNVNTIVVCLKSSVVCSIAYASGNFQRVLYEFTTLLIVTTLYQGLLSISYVIHDPFGEGTLDFPMSSLIEYVAGTAGDVLRAQHLYPGTPTIHKVDPNTKKGWVPDKNASATRARCDTDQATAGVVNAAIERAKQEVAEYKLFAAKLAAQFNQAADNVAQLHDAIDEAQSRRSTDAKDQISAVPPLG